MSRIVSSPVGVNTSSFSSCSNQQPKKRQTDPLKENHRDKKYSKISQTNQYYARTNPQLKSNCQIKRIHNRRIQIMQATMKKYWNEYKRLEIAIQLPENFQELVNDHDNDYYPLENNVPILNIVVVPEQDHVEEPVLVVEQPVVRPPITRLSFEIAVDRRHAIKYIFFKIPRHARALENSHARARRPAVQFFRHSRF